MNEHSGLAYLVLSPTRTISHLLAALFPCHHVSTISAHHVLTTYPKTPQALPVSKLPLDRFPVAAVLRRYPTHSLSTHYRLRTDRKPALPECDNLQLYFRGFLVGRSGGRVVQRVDRPKGKPLRVPHTAPPDARVYEAIFPHFCDSAPRSLCISLS
jgi:hypothetical protein